MAGLEYLTTQRVCEIMGCTARQARELMREVGLIKVGHGVIRRDALDRYLAVRMERTFYTAPLLDDPPKPKYDRYTKTGGKKHAAV